MALARPGGGDRSGRDAGRSGWNDLTLTGAIPDEELVEAVGESYRLVVSRLPKRDRPEGWETVSDGDASS